MVVRQILIFDFLKLLVGRLLVQFVSLAIILVLGIGVVHFDFDVVIFVAILFVHVGLLFAPAGLIRRVPAWGLQSVAADRFGLVFLDFEFGYFNGLMSGDVSKSIGVEDAVVEKSDADLHSRHGPPCC